MANLELSLSVSWHDTASPLPAATRRKAFAAARRHSRTVRLLRIALPILGVAAIAGLFALTRLGIPLPLDLSSARLSVTPNAVIMEHPNLSGFDGSEREYTVSADRATQPLSNPDQMQLEAIKATISVPGQGATTVTAGAGEYDHGDRTLRLSGDIEVDSSGGYSLRMRDAAIDFEAGTMRSDSPVTVMYSDSEVTGQRFLATEGGQRILFEGGVESTIMPPKRKLPPDERGEPGR
jgi:lipopolysaccharide export system protein LptC